MNKAYNMLEVTQMAINIEKQGYDYYKKAALDSKDETAKSVFNLLAEQEKKHIELFSNLYNLLSDISGINDDYLFDDTVAAYFQALTEKEVFDTAANTTARITSAKEAIEEGLKAEKNSILFYNEILKNTDLPEVQNILELIIEEEKKHIADLTILSKSL